MQKDVGLNWKSDPERKSFVLCHELSGDNPKEILSVESLYDGEEKTPFGIALVVGPITGSKSFRMCRFNDVPETPASIFGMGGEDDKEFVKSVCELEYNISCRLQHPFEDQMKR